MTKDFSQDSDKPAEIRTVTFQSTVVGTNLSVSRPLEVKCKGVREVADKYILPI
jgi:hypothetical protein